MSDFAARRLSVLHLIVGRVTQRVVGRRLVDNDVPLLIDTGRRSGTEQTAPLLYPDEDESMILGRRAE